MNEKQNTIESSNKSNNEIERTIIESSLLFGKDRTIKIKHHDKMYQLMITRQNKLILTK